MSNKTEFLTIRIPLETKHKIQRRAAIEDRSVSYVGHRLLLKGLRVEARARRAKRKEAVRVESVPSK
jgi:hypothetical protein